SATMMSAGRVDDAPKRPIWLIAGAAIVALLVVGVVAFMLGGNTDDDNNSGNQDETVELPSAPDGMVYVPEGSFVMGSSQASDESPPHTVRLNHFFIDQYEVTNTEYYAFVEATGYHPEPITWERPEDSVWELRGTDGYVLGDIDASIRWAHNGEPAFAMEN